MRKCSKCNVDSAMYRATVLVCPRCEKVIDADELYKLLEKMGIQRKIIDEVQKDILLKNL